MNVQRSSTGTLERPNVHNESVIRMHGRWLVLARILWIAMVVLILALFIATIPAFSDDIHNACATAACHTLIPTYTTRQYQAAGFSVNFALIYMYVLAVFFSLTFLIIGSVIFWLKFQDFMALYSSFALVIFAASFNSGLLVALVPAWWLPIQIIAFLAN